MNKQLIILSIIILLLSIINNYPDIWFYFQPPRVQLLKQYNRCRGMFMKLCPRCGHNCGINYFVKLDGEGGGFHTICKDCREALFQNNKP